MGRAVDMQRAKVNEGKVRKGENVEKNRECHGNQGRSMSRRETATPANPRRGELGLGKHAKRKRNRNQPSRTRSRRRMGASDRKGQARWREHDRNRTRRANETRNECRKQKRRRYEGAGVASLSCDVQNSKARGKRREDGDRASGHRRECGEKEAKAETRTRE